MPHAHIHSTICNQTTLPFPQPGAHSTISEKNSFHIPESGSIWIFPNLFPPPPHHAHRRLEFLRKTPSSSPSPAPSENFLTKTPFTLPSQDSFVKFSGKLHLTHQDHPRSHFPTKSLSISPNWVPLYISPPSQCLVYYSLFISFFWAPTLSLHGLII